MTVGIKNEQWALLVAWVWPGAAPVEVEMVSEFDLFKNELMGWAPIFRLKPKAMISGGLVKVSEGTEHNVNPLAFAKSIEAKAPCVAQIIRQRASLPGSSAYQENVFVPAGKVSCGLRSTLGAELIEAFTLNRKNKHFLADDVFVPATVPFLTAKVSAAGRAGALVAEVEALDVEPAAE